MIKIPQTNAYQIDNKSTIKGNILSTFNMDFFTNQGKMLVSGRGLLNTNGSTLGANTLLLPAVNFKYFNGRIYAVGGSGQAATNVYYTSTQSAGSAFVVSAETTPMQKASLNNSDMAIMYSTATSNTDKLYATNDEAKVYFLPYSGGVAGTWSSFSFGTANTPHLFCPFGNRMYATDNFNTILSFDASHTVATLGNSYTTTLNSPVSNLLSISWIRAAQNRLFIGAINTTGGRSAVYVWDGVQNGIFDKIIPLNSTGALSCVVLNDIPYIMDGYGVLMKFNGAYFDEIGRLPLPQGLTLYNATNQFNDRAVHPNGMAIINTQVHILVNVFQDTYQPNALSGIWCYDEDIGFYHKMSASALPVPSGSNIQDLGLAQFTRVGAVIEARSQSSLGISSTTTFTGSLSAGTTNATLSSGTGFIDQAQYNLYFSNGDKRIGTFSTSGTNMAWSGGLTSTATNGVSYDAYIQGNMLFSIQPLVGGAYNYSNSSTTGIYTNDTQGMYVKEGYIITPEAYSNDIENIWSGFYTKFQQMASPDTISIKYRTVVDVPTEALVTWTDIGVCTTTQDVSSYVIGDEMLVLSGNEAGVSGNINNISSNTAGGVTTYTIGIGNPVSNIADSGTSRVVFQKWKLIEYYQSGNTNYKPLPISQGQYFTQSIPNIENSTSPGNADTKVQLKIVCRWTGTNRGLEQIQLTEKPQVRAT